jgi:hypothetical protein
MIKSPLLIFFVILSLIVGGLIMAAGVFLFVGNSGDVGVRFKQILLGIYFVLFGFLVAVMEIWAPPSLASQIQFYQSWLGKGLSFIFIGLLVVEPPNDQASNVRFKKSVLKPH